MKIVTNFILWSIALIHKEIRQLQAPANTFNLSSRPSNCTVIKNITADNFGLFVGANISGRNLTIVYSSAANSLGEIKFSKRLTTRWITPIGFFRF